MELLYNFVGIVMGGIPLDHNNNLCRKPTTSNSQKNK